MKKGYKDSPLGAIPIDWEVVKLGEVTISFAGGTPLRSNEKYYDGTIPWIKSGEVDSRSIVSSEEHITEEALNNSSARLIQPDTILIALYGATAGKVGILKVSGCSNQAVLAICNNSTITNLNYLYYSVKNKTNNIDKLTQGSGQPNLNKRIIDSLMILLPPLAEQKRIAEVLTTVDDKIDNIGKQIDQFTELKKGLMQQLLTKGIDHTEFKDSPLGSIPKDWEVVKLGDVVNNYDNKRIPLKSEDRNKRKGNYPYYGAQGIIDYIDDYIFEGQYLLIAEDGENVKSRKNDIALLANGKFWVNNHAHVINNMKTSSLIFLKYFINQMDIKPFVTGLAQPKLNKDSLNKLMILLPPLSEQQKIAEILGSVDRKIDILESKRENVVDQKKGLMQKLLTGEKRLPYKE